MPNINQLASGDYGFKIRLWDLRTNGIDQSELVVAETGGDLQLAQSNKAKKEKDNLEKQKKKREILQEYF